MVWGIAPERISMGNFILLGNRTLDRSRITGQRETADSDAPAKANWSERIVLASAGTLGVALAFLLDPLMHAFIHRLFR